MSGYYRKQVSGNLKQGFCVALNTEPAATVTVNSDYSGLTCSVCGEGHCPHQQALREAGFYPTAIQLDELWMHRLPALSGEWEYEVLRHSVWHEPNVQHFQHPRRFRGSLRVGSITSVMLLHQGQPVADLYSRDETRRIIGEGVIYVTSITRQTCAEVKRLIACAATHCCTLAGAA